MTTPSSLAVDELRFRLIGGLHAPGDRAYEDCCTLFNAMIDRRPALVARCATPDDVIAALAFGRAHELEIAVRAGGHSVAGHSLVDDGLVLDVRGMRDIEVDPVRRVARVGAGATWAELDRATQAHGLAVTGGRVSTTGVGGLTLGGGSGWLERKHGLACDNLLAVELVTADGAFVRASATEHPELLWAHRGGGGNFGVVCTLEYALHPVGPDVLAGLVLHPADRGRALLEQFHAVMEDAPEELSLAFFYLTAPDEDWVAPELRGRLACAVGGMHAGAIADAEEALAPLRAFGPPAADLFEPMAYVDFQCMLDDPPGLRNWWTDAHLAELSSAAMDVIVRESEAMPLGSSQFALLAWGGRVARVGPDESPLGGRGSAYVAHPFALWDDAADDERVIGWARGFRDALQPHATGETYLNFIGNEGDARVRAGFAPGARERLAAVKAAWDPVNVFRGNQNVRSVA
jgi:FAD/FMN-containing dehydrogenase